MSELVAAAAVVPLLALVVVIGFRHPLWLLAVYAAVVPFGSAVAVPVGLPPEFASVSTLTGMAAAVGIGGHVVLSRNRAAWLQPTVPIWVMYLGLALATSAWSVNRGATLADVLVLVSLVALYAVSAFMAPDEADLDLLERGIVVGGALAALYGLSLLVTGNLPTPSGIPRFEVPGGGGENGDPNITAAALLLPLFVALSRGLRAPTRGARLVNLAVAGLLAGAVLLTVSRGAVLSMLVGVAAIAVVGVGRKGVLLVAVPLLIAGVAFLSAPQELRDHLFKPTSSGRTEVWEIGAEACSRHCLTGSGWATFPDVHEEILLETPWASGTRLRFVAHNIWLQAAVELGVAGVALLVAAFATAALGLRGVDRTWRAPAMAALLGLAVTNTFLSNSDFKYFWLVFVYVGVVTQVHGRPLQRTATPALARAGIPQEVG